MLGFQAYTTMPGFEDIFIGSEEIPFHWMGVYGRTMEQQRDEGLPGYVGEKHGL